MCRNRRDVRKPGWTNVPYEKKKSNVRSCPPLSYHQEFPRVGLQPTVVEIIHAARQVARRKLDRVGPGSLCTIFNVRDLLTKDIVYGDGDVHRLRHLVSQLDRMSAGIGIRGCNALRCGVQLRKRLRVKVLDV